MNAQTPGPVIASNPHPGQFALVPVNHTKQPDFWTLAYIRDFQSNDRDNAALFAAAYTSFDRAGRALGVDATKLAEAFDLAAVVNALKTIHDEADHILNSDTETPGNIARKNAWTIRDIAKRMLGALPN